MVGYSTGQRIDIRENEEFELTCKVSNAKPVAEISWYRDNVKYDAGEVFSEVQFTDSKNNLVKLCTG